MTALAPDSVLDRKYLIVRELGAGAMGTVYEAVHQITERRLALKVMKPDYARSPDAAMRFLREVRLATNLRHPNVVEVVDAGHDREAETLYIAMELLDGHDLGDEIAAGTMTPRLAVQRLREILPALELAHERGVVHRDLKPENLFLAKLPDGTEQVKLLDFGIARSLGGTTVTQTGMTVGTPMYMSPEQALRPKDVDARADLWAFGVMLYEMLAGEPPFNDQSPHALIMRAAADAHDPLFHHIPNLDPRLATLVDRCLEKKPDDRPQHAAEIREALDAVLEDPSTNDQLTVATTGVVPVPAKKRSQRELAATALASFADEPRPSVPEAAPEPRRRTPWLAAALALGALLVVGIASAAYLAGTDAAAPDPITPPTAAVSSAAPGDTAPTSVAMPEAQDPPVRPEEAPAAPEVPTEEAPPSEVDPTPAPGTTSAPARRGRRAGRASRTSPAAQPEPTAQPEPAPVTPVAAPPAPRPNPTREVVTPPARTTRPATARRGRRRSRSRRSSDSTPPPLSF